MRSAVRFAAVFAGAIVFSLRMLGAPLARLARMGIRPAFYGHDHIPLCNGHCARPGLGADEIDNPLRRLAATREVASTHF
jgi:hypothetical protein